MAEIVTVRSDAAVLYQKERSFEVEIEFVY